jgi:hypothetical protein
VLTLAGMQENDDKETAIMRASRNGMAGVVEKLLSAGAKADLRNVWPIRPVCFPATKHYSPLSPVKAKWTPTSEPDMWIVALNRRPTKPHSESLRNR